MAAGLDHIGIVGPDLDALAGAVSALGFHLTPHAAHAGGRTGNRCVMLRDGGYLELMGIAPGQRSATLERFLARGPGGHILALSVADTAAALARLRRAGFAVEEVTAADRDAADGRRARFSLVMPPDPPEGRAILIRHETPDLLWRPETPLHPNGAVSLLEAVFAADIPAATAAFLSRVAGRPAEPDPAGGYRIPLVRGLIRILPRAAATVLYPAGGGPIVGLTLGTATGGGEIFHAGGVTIRLAAGGEP